VSKVDIVFINYLRHIYFMSTYRSVELSSFEDINLNEIGDVAQVKRAIVRRIFITLYKKSRDARYRDNQEWFDLNEIVNSSFENNEKELVMRLLHRFKEFYSANNLLIDDNSVKLTQEGKEMIKFYFLSS
jgi:hypothetical protein